MTSAAALCFRVSEFLAVLVSQVGDEHLRKQHRSLAELHYSKAVSLFLSLKDAPCELLRTLLERVAFTEFTMAGGEILILKMFCSLNMWTLIVLSEVSYSYSVVCKGQSSSVAKLKSHIGAIEIMLETRHAFEMIRKELLEEQAQVSKSGNLHSVTLSDQKLLLTASTLLSLQQTETSAAESAHCVDGASSSASGLDLQEVLKLIGVFEPSFSFLLLQVIKLMTTTKRKPR